jgi:hypothetical protein
VTMQAEIRDRKANWTHWPYRDDGACSLPGDLRN